MRMLSASLRRNGCLRTFDDLQQSLLHPFTGYISGDGHILTLAGDLVDLVDIDDAFLGTLDIIVRGLDQLQQDVLDILTDISGFRKGSRVRDRKRDIQQFGERLCQIRLAGTGRPEHKDVALLQFHIIRGGTASA